VVKKIRTTIKKKKNIVLAVIVAIGSVIKCGVFFLGLVWLMQRHKLQADLKILKLERCDIVLGVD
jgi:hypothetical protein